MNYQRDFADQRICQTLIAQIFRQMPPRPVTLMEVCGTHTRAICQYGLRELLPAHLTLLSGPGCPVCVTPQREIDRAIALAQRSGQRVCLTTFGDMLRVPGSAGSLEQARARGADARVVYSALDALAIAEREPRTPVVFFGIGFETTAPMAAASLKDAQQKGIRNYFVLSAHKLMPPALRAMLDNRDTRIDGLLLPGHVSAIIGTPPYQWLAEAHRMPCAVAGFESVDLLYAIAALIKQIAAGAAAIENCYARVVPPGGNPLAQALMAEAFDAVDSEWRGLGMIPQSGLAIQARYRAFDALNLCDAPPDAPSIEPAGCLCGDILRGTRQPFDCPLFGATCTPQTPVGPCMVSSEGACGIYYAFSRKRGQTPFTGASTA